MDHDQEPKNGQNNTLCSITNFFPIILIETQSSTIKIVELLVSKIILPIRFGFWDFLKFWRYF